MDLRSCSSPHTLGLGVEHSFHCVYQEILLLQKNFLVNKLKEGTKEEDALCFLPALRESGQDDVNVAYIRRSSLVCQKLKYFPPCPLPGCLHLVAKKEDMLYTLNKIYSPACLIRTKDILCSVLLE